MDALRTLFGQTLCDSTIINSNSSSRISNITDQYSTSESHKFYAQTDENKNIFGIIFISSIPNHTMK